MGQISTLLTGAGVVTTINQNWVPQYVLVGDIETDLPLTQLAYSISGNEKLNIVGQPLIQVFSKFGKQALLGTEIKVMQLLEIADGYYGNIQFQMRLTNVGVTTPSIFGFSEQAGAGRCVSATNVTILASTNASFQGFIALAFDPANVNTVDLSFVDRDTGIEYNEAGLTADEVQAIFGIKNTTDLGGELAAITVLDNRMLAQTLGKYITRARIFNGAGGATSVMVSGLKTI